MHVGEAEVAALETEGELLVVNAQQVKNGRMDVVHVCAIFRRIETELVSLADNSACLRSAAGEPRSTSAFSVSGASGASSAAQTSP